MIGSYVAIGFFIFVLLYSVFLYQTGFIKKNVPIDWKTALSRIYDRAIPVAFVEESFFRVLIFYFLFLQLFHLDYYLAVTLTSLLFAYWHFDLKLFKIFYPFSWNNIHAESEYKPELFVGLFLFSVILCKFLLWNFFIHALAIWAVEITYAIFKDNEDRSKWWIWTNGHELLRSPIIWLIMLVVIIFVK